MIIYIVFSYIIPIQHINAMVSYIIPVLESVFIYMVVFRILYERLLFIEWSSGRVVEQYQYIILGCPICYIYRVFFVLVNVRLRLVYYTRTHRIPSAWLGFALYIIRRQSSASPIRYIIPTEGNHFGIIYETKRYSISYIIPIKQKEFRILYQSSLFCFCFCFWYNIRKLELRKRHKKKKSFDF